MQCSPMRDFTIKRMKYEHKITEATEDNPDSAFNSVTAFLEEFSTTLEEM